VRWVAPLPPHAAPPLPLYTMAGISNLCPKIMKPFFSIYVREIGFNTVINGKFLVGNFENLYFGKNKLWI
jgi:hypothetical protein